MPTERLHKILAAAGIASRRKAEQLISKGLVSLNGKVVREPGVRADPAQDEIRVEGMRIEPATRGDHVYLLLYKPAGVVSTTDDERGRTTVLDLVPRYRSRRLVLAGRLDYHSEGLVLLTDDGELVHHLTHPRHHAPRTYHAKVRGVPDEAKLDKLRLGIRLEDGKTRPAHVQVVGQARVNTWVEITLTEGRNHQVRRMFEAIGHPVQRLVRVMLGNLSIEGLPAGTARELLPAEVRALRELVEVPAQRPRKKVAKAVEHTPVTTARPRRRVGRASSTHEPRRRSTREPATAAPGREAGRTPAAPAPRGRPVRVAAPEPSRRKTAHAPAPGGRPARHPAPRSPRTGAGTSAGKPASKPGRPRGPRR